MRSPVRYSYALTSIGLAMAAAILVAPATARAAFTVSYGTMPANACRKVGTSGVLAYEADGSIYNNVAAGNPGLTVECPVPSAAQGFATKPKTTVTYFDQSPSSISCTLQTEDNNSTAFQTWTQTSTTDGSYATMSFSGVQGYADGHMHFRCVIPPKDNAGHRSYIVGYQIDDDDFIDQNTPSDYGYHTFPGSMCRQISSGSIWLTNDGAIGNTSTSAMTFDCPLALVRKSHVTQSKTKLWYLDSSPSVFTCTLSAESADTTAVSQKTLNSNVDDNGYHSFTFSGSNAVTTFEGGYIHYRCSVPPPDSGGAASFIVGYGLNYN